MFRYSIIFFLLCLVWSCTDDLDFGQTENIAFNPSATVPLINGRLDMDDASANSDSSLLIDPDELMRLYFRQDSMIVIRAEELLEIPNQSPSEISLSSSTPSASISTALGTVAGAELDSLSLHNGFLRVTIRSSAALNQDLQIETELLSVTRNGQAIVSNDILQAGNIIASDSLSLANTDFDLVGPVGQRNFIRARITLLNPSVVPPGESVDIRLHFVALDLASAYGFFGQRLRNIPAGNFTVETGKLNEFFNGISFTNPEARFITTNEANLPLIMEARLQAVNKVNDKEPLQAPPYTLSGAPDRQSPEVDVFALNTNNSNVVDFLGIIPQIIFYSGNVEMNPSGPAYNNFIVRDSKVVVDFEMDVPLEFRASDMQFDETVAVGFDFNDPEEVSDLALIFKSQNSIPLDMAMEVTYLSATGDSLGGFVLDLLTAAPVDINGRSTGESVSESIIELDRAAINAIVAATDFRVVGRISTDNNGAQEVKIYSDNRLDFQIAAKGNFIIQSDGE